MEMKEKSVGKEEMKEAKGDANSKMGKDSITNCACVRFDALSMNEGFARMVAMGFMMDMNPTMDELADVKTAVSEAVTNAIIHGYGEIESEEADHENYQEHIPQIEVSKTVSQVEMTCLRKGQLLTIIVEDFGVGILDVEKAREPFYTTKPDMERSGMGFAFMETFMDEVAVWSKPGEGTRVTMSKYISQGVENLKEDVETAKEEKKVQEVHGV